MTSPMAEHGTFKASPAAQSQQKPGLESRMVIPSEPVKLEGENEFTEYTGSGKLKGKKALITGGDSGIGRAVAIMMAREGADVSIGYLPEEQEDADFTKSMIEKSGTSCVQLPGDLRDHNMCRQVVDEHVKKYGTINILVNNASKQRMYKDFLDTDLDGTLNIFKSNVIQMIAMSKYAIPHMSRGDSIINTSSVVAFRGSSHMIDYAASKGAIVSFTKALASHYLHRGIRVNAVAPGAIYTPIQADTREAKQMEGWGAKSGLSRPGQPSEVAPTFVFLASAEASLYYGQVMHCYPLGD